MSLLALMLLAAAEPETAIEAERAFASDAQQIGQWAAFGKWASEDGVLVGRNPVNARQTAAMLAKEGEPSVPLYWWPSKSYVSCDKKTVVNTGPYVSPMTGTFGQFVTVWQRGDGGWRYVVDTGAELDIPLTVPDEVEIIRPDCESTATPRPPTIFAAGVKAGLGSSADNSLRWEWTLRPNVKRAIQVELWDGNSHVRHLRVEKDLLEPTQ